MQWQYVADIRSTFVQLLTNHEDNNLGEAKGVGAHPPYEDPMLEIMGASFIADEPTILGTPDYEYITREVSWYDSQSLNVADIPEPIPPIWRKVADEFGNILSNYGFLVYNAQNGNQFGQVVRELMNDKDSRRAVMIYTRPTMHAEAKGDFVCTNTVQYVIRDNQLHAIVQMRSNDAVFGYRNDYAWQSIIHTRLWRELKTVYPDIKMGSIVWQAQSLHIYPRHIPLLKRAIAYSNWYIQTK